MIQLLARLNLFPAAAYRETMAMTEEWRRPTTSVPQKEEYGDITLTYSVPNIDDSLGNPLLSPEAIAKADKLYSSYQEELRRYGLISRIFSLLNPWSNAFQARRLLAATVRKFNTDLLNEDYFISYRHSFGDRLTWNMDPDNSDDTGLMNPHKIWKQTLKQPIWWLLYGTMIAMSLLAIAGITVGLAFMGNAPLILGSVGLAWALLVTSGKLFVKLHQLWTGKHISTRTQDTSLKGFIGTLFNELWLITLSTTLIILSTAVPVGLPVFIFCAIYFGLGLLERLAGLFNADIGMHVHRDGTTLQAIPSLWLGWSYLINNMHGTFFNNNDFDKTAMVNTSNSIKDILQLSTKNKNMRLRLAVNPARWLYALTKTLLSLWYRLVDTGSPRNGYKQGDLRIFLKSTARDLVCRFIYAPLTFVIFLVDLVVYCPIQFIYDTGYALVRATGWCLDWLLDIFDGQSNTKPSPSSGYVSANTTVPEGSTANTFESYLPHQHPFPGTRFFARVAGTVGLDSVKASFNMNSGGKKEIPVKPFRHTIFQPIVKSKSSVDNDMCTDTTNEPPVYVSTGPAVHEFPNIQARQI